MAGIESVVGQNRVGSFAKTREFPVGSLRFDRLMIGVSYWFLIGMYLDGWAHNHGQTDSSFFTPWHGVLYSGAFTVLVVLGITQIRNMKKGHTWLRALPAGYFPALLGIGIFSIGGVFDLIWHTLFGVEANIQALLSPSHLLLAAGSFLFISAPLHAAWIRQDKATWRTLLPTLLSMTAVLSHLTFFTQYANFASRPLVLIDLPPGIDSFYISVYGVMSVLIPTSLGISLILLALRRWNLPVGAVTFLWTLNSVLMIWLRFRFVASVLPALVAVPLGAMLADFLLWRLKPLMGRPISLRLFAFSIPFVISLSYLLILNTFGTGLWWQIHMWLGVPVLAGIAGVFLSLLADTQAPLFTDNRSAREGRE
jgi:hypothetical protein